MPRPCNHPTGDPIPEECPVCKLYVEREDYRKLWDTTDPFAKFRRKPCKHLLLPTGQSVVCTYCNQKKTVPLMGCSLFHACTENILSMGTPCCAICDKREDTA